MNNWLRVRFFANEDDWRPVKWPKEFMSPVFVDGKWLQMFEEISG